jgi:hypothetical protein
VRADTLLISLVVLGGRAITPLVLAGVLPDNLALRVALLRALALVLGTLLTRTWYGVLPTTSPEPPGKDAESRDLSAEGLSGLARALR